MPTLPVALIVFIVVSIAVILTISVVYYTVMSVLCFFRKKKK